EIPAGRGEIQRGECQAGQPVEQGPRSHRGGRGVPGNHSVSATGTVLSGRPEPPRALSRSRCATAPGAVVRGADACTRKEPGDSFEPRASGNTPGSDLLSHTPAGAVPSAVAGLTSVFGMGTGVALPL